MLKDRFDRLREKGALIHNITNYVTVNDVANMLLACGVLLCSVILNGFLPVPGLQNSAFRCWPMQSGLVKNCI